MKLARSPLDIPFLAFLLIAGISTLLSKNIYVSLLGECRRNQGFFTLISYAFLYYLSFNFFCEKRDFRRFLIALFASCSVISIIGILQYLGITFGEWNLYYIADPARSSSTLGNPIYLGGYLVLVIPVAMIIVLCTEEFWNFGRLVWLKNLALMNVLLAIPCLVFTFCRAAWLAFAMSIIFLVIAFRRHLWQKKFFCLVLLLFLIAEVITLYAFHGSFVASGKDYALGERLASLAQFERGTAASRILMWQSSLKIIADNPLMGTGSDTFWLVFPSYLPPHYEVVVRENARPGSPHNDLLEVATGMGVLGLITYLWLLIVFFRVGVSLFKALDRRWHPLSIGLLAGIIGYLIQIQFSFHVIGVAPIFWMIIGLAMTVTRLSGFVHTKELKLDFGGKRWGFAARLIISLLTIVFTFYLLKMAIIPFVADLHARRALDHLQFGLYDDAIGEAKLAVRLYPLEEEYLFLLGKIYEFKSDAQGDSRWYKEAISTYIEALRFNPRERNGYARLGDAYLKVAEKGDLKMADKAIETYKKLIKLEPNYSQSHYNLGVAYYLKGELDEAIAQWQRTVELKPDELDAYLLMGKAYHEKGAVKGAICAYKKALELDPFNMEVHKALRQLKE